MMSSRANIAVSAELHERAKAAAARSGETLIAFAAAALERAIAAAPPPPAIPEIQLIPPDRIAAMLDARVGVLYPDRAPADSPLARLMRGAGLRNIAENGIDAELADIESEMAAYDEPVTAEIRVEYDE